MLDSVDSSMNLEVTSQATQDNSDDDVIEVVRDEAPIEILSDGEELELQIQQSEQALNSIVIENVHFTPVQETAGETEKMKDPIEDPLKNFAQTSFCSDLLNALDPSYDQIESLVLQTTDAKISDEEKIPNENNETVSGVKACFIKKDGRYELMVGDHRFKRHYTGLMGRTRWRCCKYFSKCLANAITDSAQKSIVKLNDKHNHGPDKGMKARFVVQGGRSVLMVGENRYLRHYTSRTGRTRWRCCKSFNKCLAIVITEGNHIVKLNDTHNHDPSKHYRKWRRQQLTFPEGPVFYPFAVPKLPIIDDRKDPDVTEKMVLKPLLDICQDPSYKYKEWYRELQIDRNTFSRSPISDPLTEPNQPIIENRKESEVAERIVVKPLVDIFQNICN